MPWPMQKVGKTVKYQRILSATSAVPLYSLFLCVPVILSKFQTIGMMPPMSKFKKSVKIYATVSDLKYSEVK